MIQFRIPWRAALVGGGRQLNNQRLNCYDFQGRARFDVEDVDELVLFLIAQWFCIGFRFYLGCKHRLEIKKFARLPR